MPRNDGNKPRDDIEKELNGLIEDMLAEKCKGLVPTKKDVIDVLTELGDPSSLADRYGRPNRYIIGPDYFDTYLLVLKVVMATVALIVTIVTIVDYMVSPPTNILEAITSVVFSAWNGLLNGFAWVTVVFVINEHFGLKFGEQNAKKRWSPSDLPPIPVKAMLIKPSEPLLGIIFTILFIILLNFGSHLLGAYQFENGQFVSTIPVFNETILRSFLPIINTILALSIAGECLQLIVGKWTIPLALVNAFVNLATLLLGVIMFSNSAFWNDAFITYIANILSIPDIENLWSIIVKVFIGLFAFGLIIDSVVSFVKAFKLKVASYL